jgi:PAP2 superfamily
VSADWTRRRLVLLVGGYAAGLAVMIQARGLYLTPDRYALILLVPALALGVARRYVVDFLPLVALVIAYEVLRGEAHVLSPHPYFTPQLRAEKALFAGRVPTVWLQRELWNGRPTWWQTALSVLLRLHFIVPPTLLFVVWLRDRACYYRYAATLVAVSYAALLGFWRFPAAPPWLAARHHLIAHVARIDLIQANGVSLHSPPSWLYQNLVGQNSAAAIPSIHAAYSLLVTLFCLGLSPRLGVLGVAYAALMQFAIVLSAEHYVVDAVAGDLLALMAFAVVPRLIRATRLGGPFPAPLATARAGRGKATGARIPARSM